MNVTIYSKQSCVACKATKRALDKQGVAYVEIFLDTDEQALNTVKSLGYTQAPVVMAGAEHWAGFRPDKIKTLTNNKERTPSYV